MDWLKTLAPTVASALLGPLGGIAVEILGPALGISDATTEKVTQALSSGQLSGEQIAAIKQAELALQSKEQELGFRFAELEVKREEIAASDRDSARKREMTVRDNTPRNLAYILVGAFIATVGATLAGWSKVDSVLAGTLIGYLSAKAEQAIAYFLGSTKGSADKTATITEMARKTSG